ncbi:GNAT family N-acetyltransferase [Streptomyces sp. NPDC001617]
MPYTSMPLRIDTDRLILRRWSETDIAAHRALVAERGGGMPSVEDNRRMIDAQFEEQTRTGLALPAVRRRAEGDFIGYCGLTVGRASVDEPEIAYELFRHAHGLGGATEAASAVVEAAVDTGRRRLWSSVRTWDAPSFRVPAKLGFTRDHVTPEEGGELVWLSRSLP